MKIWQLILSLFGIESKNGPAQSLPNSPYESKTNLNPELSAEKKMPNKSNALEGLVKIALSQVGVKESGGNNNGPEVRLYQTATELKPASWPWCAAFTGWTIREWLKDSQTIEWLGLKILTPEQWRPRTAAAFGYIAWAKDRPATTKVLSNRCKPAIGDLVIFDFSHIGIVSKVGEKDFQCVEGNTNGRGTRDSTSGDGVWLKTRTPSLVRNYIRINPSTIVA